jgi:hypothetical protein
MVVNLPRGKRMAFEQGHLVQRESWAGLGMFTSYHVVHARECLSNSIFYKCASKLIYLSPILICLLRHFSIDCHVSFRRRCPECMTNSQVINNEEDYHDSGVNLTSHFTVRKIHQITCVSI